MKPERDSWFPRVLCVLICALLLLYSAKFFARLHVPWIFRMADTAYSNPWQVGIPVSHKYWVFPYSPMIYATLLLVFLLAFFFRRKVHRACTSLTAGFMVSFLVEMYGVAFSTYAIHALLGQPDDIPRPFSPPTDAFFFNHVCRFPSLVLGWATGIALIWIGWNRIHRGADGLVTTGIYARLRHPQYLGLFLISLGVLVFCPTPMQLVLFVVLNAMYYRLSLTEDRELEATFGEAFREYRSRVPAFFPRLRATAAAHRTDSGTPDQQHRGACA